MAHSFTISAFHIVFSTKHRRPLISPETPPILWKYLARIARNHGMVVLGVGGTDNHTHILISLPPDTSLASAVRDLKANSSRWTRETNRNSAWQEGYGAFSVSVQHLERVKNYIVNQLCTTRRNRLTMNSPECSRRRTLDSIPVTPSADSCRPRGSLRVRLRPSAPALS
jgi:putative transposase